jgi:predicted GTPase
LRGVIAAQRYGTKEIINPRPFAVGLIKDTFDKYPNIGMVLQAIGYGAAQIRDLETTINNSDTD